MFMHVRDYMLCVRVLCVISFGHVQRVYGCSFPDKKLMKEHLTRLEEAKKVRGRYHCAPTAHARTHTPAARSRLRSPLCDARVPPHSFVYSPSVL